MVSLNEILISKEERVKTQRSLLCEYKKPLICFTMNIAGPVKTSPLIERAFGIGTECILSKIPPEKILKKIICSKNTGCEMYLSADLQENDLKILCTDIEDTHPLGRLFDMDVLSPDGTKLERKIQRGCIVCSSPGRDCAARRMHSADEVYKVMTDIMTEYFVTKDAETISNLAVQCLIDEVNTTPKPGLVDMNNSGSHRDMNREMFIKSAYTLKDYFEDCFVIGAKNKDKPTYEIFGILKRKGMEAEEKMYLATKGVNTHKGIIYSLGLLTASAGINHKGISPFVPIDAILSTAGELAKHSSLPKESRTERMCSKYSIGGILTEAKSGFTTVKNIGLKSLISYISEGMNIKDAGSCTLLHFICETEDTNLYYRGGKEGVLWAKESARKLLKSKPSKDEIQKLDQEFIKRNLSPGGSADLLALTYFLFNFV